MRLVTRTAAVVGAAALIASLAACSSPLTAADVTTSLTTGPVSDLIPGDTLEVTPAVTLIDGRTDELDLTVEASVNGGDWTAVRSPVTLDTAGTWEFRPVATPSESKDAEPFEGPVTRVTVVDLEKLVTDLYYGDAQAWQDGAAQGYDYTVAHNYPGIWDATSATAVDTRNQAIQYEADWGVPPGGGSVPDLSTLTPDNTWSVDAATGRGSSCAVPGARMPGEGRTFTIVADSGLSKAQVHVTLKDGTVYYYVNICDWTL